MVIGLFLILNGVATVNIQNWNQLIKIKWMCYNFINPFKERS